MIAPTDTTKRTLLIVDDREDVLRALERLMSLCFDEVLVAHSADEAERLLADHAPPYLLCDYWLGDGQAVGTTLISRWRKQHPELRRVALMTGTNTTSVPNCPGVDEMFKKPINLDSIVSFFAD